jgi:hypothetical protein
VLGAEWTVADGGGLASDYTLDLQDGNDLCGGTTATTESLSVSWLTQASGPPASGVPYSISAGEISAVRTVSGSSAPVQDGFLTLATSTLTASSGSFSFTLTLADGGTGTLDGTFNAPYCAP